MSERGAMHGRSFEYMEKSSANNVHGIYGISRCGRMAYSVTEGDLAWFSQSSYTRDKRGEQSPRGAMQEVSSARSSERRSRRNLRLAAPLTKEQIQAKPLHPETDGPPERAFDRCG